MQKFYYFLRENPQYPEIMMASSKAEVKQLLLENIGQDNEDQIINILSENEMNKKSNPDTGGLYKDSTEYSNGNDFLNDVIKSANNELIQNSNIGETSIQPHIFQNVEKPQPVKYFEESGIQFKVENGRVYKKVWTLINEDEMKNYRIINAASKKPLGSNKYSIEKLDWIEIS